MASLAEWWLNTSCPVAGLPSLRAVAILSAYVAFLIVAGAILPGKVFPGTVLADGTRLHYKCNGFRVLLLLLALLGYGVQSGHLSATIVADLAGELFATTFAFTVLLSLALYLAGVFSTNAKSSSLKPKFHGNFISDFIYGVQLNPSVFGLDLKFFCLRPAMMGWLLINLSIAAKQHELLLKLPDNSHAITLASLNLTSILPASVASSSIATLPIITLPMFLYQVFTAIYVLDYFWFEEYMTSTWDIIAENFGFMLVFGDLIWIPFTFSVQAWWLLAHGTARDSIAATVSLPFAIVTVAVFVVGYAVFRGANRQKHIFKHDPTAKIWGKTPRVVGGRLLVSGYWGIARHCNYLGDLMLALSYSLPCAFYSLCPYFYPIYLLILLLWRERRDEARCRAKYPRTNQAVASRSPLAAARNTALSRTSPSRASILGNQTPQIGKHHAKTRVRVAAVATGEQGEEGGAVCLAAADRPPFDLNLAVLLAGFAFESYNTPQEDKDTLWEQDVGGCRTIFTSYGFAYELYSGQLIVTVQSASDVPAVDLWVGESLGPYRYLLCTSQVKGLNAMLHWAWLGLPALILVASYSAHSAPCQGTSDPYMQASVGEGSVRTRTIWTDPYVQASVGEASARTRTIWTSTAPEWNEEIRLLVKADDTSTQYLKLSMWDDGIVISPRRLGNASIRLDDLLDGETHEQEVALEGPGGGATLKLAVRYRSFAELAEEERRRQKYPSASSDQTRMLHRTLLPPSLPGGVCPLFPDHHLVEDDGTTFSQPRWRLPSLDDIFSGQLPLVSGFQDVITSALQPSSSTPAADSTPAPTDGSAPATSQPSPAISTYEFVRSAIQQFGAPSAFPTSLDKIRDSVVPTQSAPQAAAAAEATGSAEITAENADTGSSENSGREEQVRQAVGLAREVLLRAGWIPPGGTLDQLSQAVMSGTDSGTGASGSSSSSSSNSESAPAAASGGFDLGSAASAAAGGLLEGAAGAVAGRIEQRRAELRRSLTDMGITLPWYDQKNGQGADGQSSSSDAAAAAGDFLEGATSALVGRIEQRRAELRKSLVDLGITLPWYDQSSGQGVDGEGTVRQASPATDVTASQEPSSFSSSLDDLRKAAFRQTEGVLGSLALLGSTAGSLPLAEGEKKSAGAAKSEGETGGEESEGAREGASEGVSEGASEVVSEEETEEALRMFGSAETAVEAWTMLASSLGQQTFVKSEFDKVCFVDHPQSDTQVAVWRDVRRKRIVVAFRGTEQTKAKDLLTDISLSPSSLDFERTSSGDFDQDVMVHGGFLAAYDSVRARLRSLIAIITDPNRPTPLTARSADADAGADGDSSIHAADSLSEGDTWRVYLTGHSLGGALSTLFAYELSQSNMVRERNIHLTMYNYGSPRVGNAAFVARFNVYMCDSWRIVNRADIVPTVPKLMGYRHVCCPVYLSPGGPSGDLQSDASQEQLGVDDGYAAEVVGEANANDILEDYMKGERRLIDRLLQTEVAMLSALRDGSAIMMHMEDFYYIALLKKVRESLGVSQ
ncbi:unnamed protein product [Closterium sp. NIES-64]|nr:unnamed protein product [Closterium sp. NIES-64]